MDRSNRQAYSPGVLVGNWHEDMALREDQLKLYMAQRTAAEQAEAARAAQKDEEAAQRQRLLTATTITSLPGEPVEFDRTCILMNAKTKNALALDLPPPGTAASDGGCLSTADISVTGPVVRTTWALLRCKDANNRSYNRNASSVVHYGQHVRLANMDASEEGFVYVNSTMKSGMRSSDTQQTTVSLRAGGENVFVIVKPGARRENEQEGGPVRFGESVLLVHALTNLPLACAEGHVTTSFGEEDAVTCTYVLKNASRARLAVTTDPANLFTFAQPKLGEASPQTRSRRTTAVVAKSVDPRAESMASYMEHIRLGALRMGGRIGFRALSLALGVAGEERRQRILLDRATLRSAVAKMGVKMSAMELEMVMKRFDKDGDNHICAQDFLASMRGALPQERLDAVLWAYNQLLVEGQGTVELENMMKLLCANVLQLPDVKEGLIDRGQAVQDFENCWPGKVGGKVGPITREEFIAFCTDISPAESDDDRFIATVQRAWAVPASSKYSTAGPRRMVHVVRKDNSVLDISVPDTLVIDPRDNSVMRQLLLQHGVRDVKDFTVKDRW